MDDDQDITPADPADDAPEAAAPAGGADGTGAGDPEDGAQGAPEDADKPPTDWPPSAVARVGKLTARRAGLLPDLLTPGQVKAVDKAERLADGIRRLEETADICDDVETEDGKTVKGYTDADGNVVPLARLKQWLRKAREDYAEVKADADAARKQASADLAELLRLGKAAKAAKWSPDAKPAARPAARPVLPGPGGPPPKRVNPETVNWKSIKTAEDAIAALSR